MRSFSINFPSIALIPVALFIIFLSIFIISEWMFSLEAFYRGYDLEPTPLHNPNVGEERIENCYYKENTTDVFCKENYGMLGWKQWFSYEEQNDIIEKFPTIKIGEDGS